MGKLHVWREFTCGESFDIANDIIFIVGSESKRLPQSNHLPSLLIVIKLLSLFTGIGKTIHFVTV